MPTNATLQEVAAGPNGEMLREYLSVSHHDDGKIRGDAGPQLLYSTNHQYQTPFSGFTASAETTPLDVMSITGFFDGRPVIMELSIWDVQLAAAVSNQLTFNLWEDGVDTGRRARIWSIAASAMQGSIYRRWTHVPPVVGNQLTQHTYDIRCWGVGVSSIFVGADPNAGASTPMEFNIYKAVQL